MTSSQQLPGTRLLLLATETVFSYWFWTMITTDTDKDWGIGSFCPWPRHQFTYNGLSSHSPLLELTNKNVSRKYASE